MKLGKIFICINILVLSLLMLTGCMEKWPRIIYQNTSYRFDEYNRTIVLDDGYVLDGGHSYDIVETEDIRRRNLKIVIRKRKWFSRF